MNFEIGMLGFPFLGLPLLGGLMMTWALRSRFGTPGVQEWIAGMWLLMAGNALLAVRAPATEALAIPLRNAAWVAGAGLLWVGNLRHGGRTASLRPLVALLLLVVPLQAYFAWIHPAVLVRSVILSAAMSLIFTAGALALRTRGPSAVSGIRTFAQGLFALHACFYGVRGAFLLRPALARSYSLEGAERVATMSFLTLSLVLLQATLWALAHAKTLRRA